MTTAVADRARRAVEDVIAGRMLLVFYVAVLGVALVGSTQGVEHWIGWPLPAAFGAVVLAEVGGVALSVFADRRRQKGERAVAARVLSAAFAAGALAVQLRGHADAAGHITGAGLFFAGFSAAGYVIYLLDSAAKRRDALRAAGKLADTPPAYGAYQWARHPWLTARARRLAVTNAEARLVERLTSREHGGPDLPTTPLIGRAASLTAAADQVRRERRLAAIRGALRERITAGVSPTMATIAVNTYDIDRVADGLADGADYPALTGLLAAELTPIRIAAGITARKSRRSWWRGPGSVQTNEIVAALAVETAVASAVAAAETAPETVETDPETAPETAPETVETDPAPALPAPRTPETDKTGEPVDQVDDGPTPALPPIPPAMLPHLTKVMQAHRDWHLTIGMPGRHPDALTYAKIKAAAGISGQQLCSDIRTALLSIRFFPEAAEAYVGVAEPAAANA